MKPLSQLLEILTRSHDLVDQVHSRSLDLIATTGIRFHSERAREILHGAGAEVDGDVVKIPGHLVESALKQAPATFTLHARDGRHDLPVDGRQTYFSQDGCAAHTLDFDTGLRRGSRKADIAAMARITDALDAIDIVTPTVSAQDVPPAGITAHEIEACFLNTGKHVVTESVTTAREARAQIELASVIAGGPEPLRERPIFCNFVCSISPLTQDGGGTEAALEFAGAGVPVGIYPMATTGVTSPVTRAGSAVVVNAEVISGLALLQLAHPGAKVFYAGGPATIDLRTGAYIAGSPEALWLRMMVARMAGYYGLPCITGAGATSAKEPGPQAAWENVLSFLLPSLAGASFLFGVGLLDGSNLLTYEQIILDAEVAAFLKRLLAPVASDETAFAMDLIAELGAGGVYMDQLHTVKNMRQALWLPALSDRDSYDEWQAKGARSRVELARDRVRQILAEHEPPSLPDSTREAMRDVVAAYSAGKPD